MKIPNLAKICCAATLAVFSVPSLMADPNTEKAKRSSLKTQRKKA